MTGGNPASGARPQVSVVVAARNAERTLDRCLASLEALDYPNLELLLVDDGSTDATRSIAAQFPVRIVVSPGTGPSEARNLGVAQASGEIVAFTDADCTVPPDWATALVAAFAASGAAAVGGRQRNAFTSDENAGAGPALDAFFRLASVIAEYTRSDDHPRVVRHNASCNSAYRRDVFLAVGGFRPGLWPGEDVELDHRLHLAGHRCYYTPEAVVTHHRPGTLWWLASTMRRYGQSARAVRMIHGRFRPLHWLPLVVASLVALQGLLLLDAARLFVAALDITLVIAALVMLWRSTPLRLWPRVLLFAGISASQWLRGYIEGPRPAAR